MSIIINKAISALDTPTSLLPFFVKDTCDLTGRTLMAQNEGGKHEAREKFIEEAGTSIFWIGGIPAVRWIANKITKATSKIDPDIHFKRINCNGIQNYFADEIVESGKNKFNKQDLGDINIGATKGKLASIKKNLSELGYIPNKSKGIYKKYHVGITAAAVIFNLGMLTVALPMFNQFLSRKIISKEISNKQNNKDQYIENNKDNLDISSTQNTNNTANPSFGSLKDLLDFKNLLNFTQMAEKAQLNVTNSMLLLDYGISGSRVSFVPRNNNERIEYGIKEGGIILFFYYAADWIKKGFSTIANKVFKSPIDLDYRIINDKDFTNTFINNNNTKEIFSFTDKTDEVNIIKFIDKELEKASNTKDSDKVFSNFTLKMAQKSGLVDVEYDDEIEKWIRHSKKYIETDKIVELNKNLENFYEQSLKSGTKSVKSIVNKTKAIKAASVIGNIAICCVSLSYFLPKLQYYIREKISKTSEAPGIKQYEEMAKNNLI